MPAASATLTAGATGTTTVTATTVSTPEPAATYAACSSGRTTTCALPSPR